MVYGGMFLIFWYLDNAPKRRDNVNIDASTNYEIYTRLGRRNFGKTFRYHKYLMFKKEILDFKYKHINKLNNNEVNENESN